MRTTAEALIEDPTGHYPHATVACFDPTRGDLPRRALDASRTIAMLERYAASGADAVLIASSTGQGHLRSIDELESWLDCAARAQLDETTPIALLRPEDGAPACIRLLDLIRECGYPLVFFRPGMDLPPAATEDQVVAQLGPLIIAAATRGLAVGLYSVSDVSGMPLTAAATARLVVGPGGDHIVAVKITESDYNASTANFLAHPQLQHLKIVQGWDPHLGRALRDGGHRVGITSGLMALEFFQYQHLLAAADRRDWPELATAQQAASLLFAAMQDQPDHFADLQRAKFLMGLGQPLCTTVEKEQVERIFAALEAVPRTDDRRRIARSLDLMGDGPFTARLQAITGSDSCG